MAVRYYYFQGDNFDLAFVQARVPVAVAVVAPTFTGTPFVVVRLADDTPPNEADLLGAMSSAGYTYVDSTLVAPVFTSVRDFGVLSAAPTVPVPAVGDRYHDSVYGPLVYTGTSWVGIQTFSVPFAFNTASPLALTSLRTTDRIMRSDVQITTLLDGGAALQLGTAGTPGAILDSPEIDPAVVNTYRTFDIFEVGVLSNIILTITPAAATQGAGRVYLEIWRAS
jgi:hypothetical protein